MPYSYYSHIRRITYRKKDKIAVIANNTEYTYEDLDWWICKYITAFNEAGVTNGQVIGLHIERGFELIALIFSILYLRCCFYLLDRNYTVGCNHWNHNGNLSGCSMNHIRR